MPIENLHYCIHGHAVHAPTDVGGRCKVCHGLLCKECAQLYRCQIDGDVICRHHAFRNADGQYICSSHNFFAKVRFSIDWSIPAER